MTQSGTVTQPWGREGFYWRRRRSRGISTEFWRTGHGHRVLAGATGPTSYAELQGHGNII